MPAKGFRSSGIDHMDGQTGFRHHSADYPMLRDARAVDSRACYLDTVASFGLVKPLDALYRSAAKLPEQVRT